VDGMSLLAGVVKFFAQHTVLSMFALHFTEIFENSMFPIEIQQKINCFRMDALAEAEDNHSENLGIDAVKLIPLFKLKYGLSKSSYGISCARDMGVPEKVLIRAQEVKVSIRNKLPLAPIHSLLPLNIQPLSTDEKELLRNILQKYE
jgi:DNA mismatch repair ATPase MutS